jgi:SAM-dependent methyltransferase
MLSKIFKAILHVPLFKQSLSVLLRQFPALQYLIPKLGIIVPIVNADRDFLEQKIFPMLAEDRQIKKILFAGVGSYTWHYFKFFPQQDFYTIDFDAKKAPFGQPGMHVVGSVVALSDHYASDFFDAVIISGLIGYGVNSKQDIDQTYHEAFKVLRPGGMLIMGWNNQPALLSFPLETLDGYHEFDSFAPAPLELAKARVEVNLENAHTFEFMRKPLVVAQQDAAVV